MGQMEHAVAASVSTTCSRLLALLDGGAVVEVLHAKERRRAGLGTQGGAEKTRTQGGVRGGVRATPLAKCM